MYFILGLCFCVCLSGLLFYLLIKNNGRLKSNQVAFYNKAKSLKKDFIFDYNIPYSPQNFDPLLQFGLNSRYLLNHLQKSLYKWDQNNKLILSAAENCEWKQAEFICKLKRNSYFELTHFKNVKTEITAQHYLNSLELIKENPKSEFLDFKSIEFYAKDKFTLVFKLKQKNESFKFKLAQIETSPRPEKKYYEDSYSYFSGDYKITNFKKNEQIELTHRFKPNLKVKVHFIDDQSTALRLFRTETLDLLTLLPVREFVKYQNTNQIFHIPMARMDGVFFNTNLDINLKKALIHSLNYKHLQSLYKSIGVPGCPTLSKELYLASYCYDFDLKKAKSFLSKVKDIPLKLVLSYSSSGGDDIQRGMEWMAYEWKQNLNLNVTLDPLENGVFFNKLKTRKFDIIRRGFQLDSPYCLDGLRQFQSKNTNNVSQFNNKNFDDVLLKLEFDPLSKNYCDQALKILHDSHVYLPLGSMYFSFLQNNKFSGWYINSLNILDLEHLQRISP